MPEAILLLIAAYLIGGIPFSFLLAKLAKGVDLRTVGSGNVGATNASRLFAKPWSLLAFLACFALDALKGFLPAYFLGPLLADGPLAAWSAAERCMVIGLAAILGHIYTPYLRFRGGKGVATSFGVFMAAAPWAVIVTGLIGIIVILVSRYVSLGSVIMAFLLPILVFVHDRGEYVVLALSLVVSFFVVYKHWSNIKRLISGQEAKLFTRQFDMSDDPHLESHQ